jgi:hypothetical protein
MAGSTRSRPVRTEARMLKTAVRMPEAKWVALKVRAAQERTTVQQLLEDAVTLFLKTPVKPAQPGRKP